MKNSVPEFSNDNEISKAIGSRFFVCNTLENMFM